MPYNRIVVDRFVGVDGLEDRQEDRSGIWHRLESRPQLSGL